MVFLFFVRLRQNCTPKSARSGRKGVLDRVACCSTPLCTERVRRAACKHVGEAIHRLRHSTGTWWTRHGPEWTRFIRLDMPSPVVSFIWVIGWFLSW